jgi:type IV secretion system protein VirB1
MTAAKKLEREGENFSVGLMQINKKNFPKLGLSIDNAFEPCANISAGAKIIEQCFMSAKNNTAFNSEQTALRGALSCYYSGNFTRGFEKEESVGNSYVERANNVVAKYRVPKIEPEEMQEKEITTDKKDYVVAQDKMSNELDIQRQSEGNKKSWDVYGDY